jgi:hypothetical protein
MTSPVWTVALSVIDVLEELGVRYHVGGSFASSIHGVPRQTRDIDLVADLPLSAVPSFVARLREGFYLDDEAICRAIERHTQFNLVHLASGFKVDIFLPGPGAFDRNELRRSAPYQLAEEPARTVNVKSPEDTLLRKLVWYRRGGEISDRQWGDVLGIVRTQAERLDLLYLREWAGVLGVADLLERALN